MKGEKVTYIKGTTDGGDYCSGEVGAGNDGHLFIPFFHCLRHFPPFSLQFFPQIGQTLNFFLFFFSPICIYKTKIEQGFFGIPAQPVDTITNTYTYRRCIYI